jgi:hypothetical protein
MKTIARPFRFAVAFAAALLSTAAHAVESGKPAPNFPFTDIAGKSHQLSDFKGKTVVLEWVNPECPIARKHYDSGNMKSTQQAALVDGAVWISINSAGYEGAQGNYNNAKVAAWLKEMGFQPTAYVRDLDGKIGHLYHATNTPHMFVINKEGVLVYQGAIDSGDGSDIATAKNYVKATLAALKASKPVERAATKAYGCAIKYGGS